VSKSTLTHLGLHSTCSIGWCKLLAATEARTLYIEQGSPTEYGYRESFSSKLREECLNGDLLLAEGTVRAGRTLARPLQHCQYELVAGLQPRTAGRVADPSIAGHGKAGSKERFQRFHVPDYGDEPYPLRAALREQPNW
jgi:hypothetical protein